MFNFISRNLRYSEKSQSYPKKVSDQLYFELFKKTEFFFFVRNSIFFEEFWDRYFLFQKNVRILSFKKCEMIFLFLFRDFQKKKNILESLNYFLSQNSEISKNTFSEIPKNNTNVSTLFTQHSEISKKCHKYFFLLNMLMSDLSQSYFQKEDRIIVAFQKGFI